jgi:hypothetical protein
MEKKLIDLIPGDTDFICGVKIQELVLKTDTFIVYLNDHHEIYWSTHVYGTFPDDFGEVMNRVRELESINEKLFKGKDLNSFNYLVAEGVARLLDDRKTDNAQKILDKAEQKILLHGRNRNRTVYISSSLVLTIVLTLLVFVCFISKNSIKSQLSLNSYDIINASLFGGIGAFFSVFYRSNTYEPDVSLGKGIHVIDGLLRNCYGCLAGLLVALGIKANIIMGFLNQTDKSIVVISFIALISGASESLIPSLISQIEGKIHK